MDTKLLFQDAAGFQTPMLAAFAVDIAVGKDADPLLALLTTSDAVTDAAAKVMASGEFKAGLGETLLLHAPSGLKAERLLVVGLGKAKDLSVDEVRKGAGAAVRSAKPLGVRELAIAFPEDHALDDEHLETLPCGLMSRALVEGAELAEMDWDTYRSDRKDRSIRSLSVIAHEEEKVTRDDIQRGFDEGLIVAAAQNFTRSLVNEPETEKAQAAKDVPVLGLVGKGITFDTGGISIKPADGMEKMKYDMAGAATMIGAMRAIALLKPKVKVTAIICATENMPSGKAQKPGDVQIAMSGKSIEIINTDAEGRLVLADGLTYARRLGCTHLVDAATLTGAVVVALGYVNAGIFASTDEMYERFATANQLAGEKMWRLPLDDEYKDNIRSNIADIVNSGGRWGGAVNAAMFLKEFAEDTPWLHLDIAGTAWMEENKPWIAKGPSGIAVRSLVQFAREFNN